MAWFNSDGKQNKQRKANPRHARRTGFMRNRRPIFEELEQRHMLTTLMVDSLADNMVAGDGLVTLREAIMAANNDTATDDGDTGSGADVIAFDPALFATPPETINLDMALGEMEITESLTIQGPGFDQLTIDADNNSRIFNITNAAEDVTISGLTLIGGTVTGTDEGGAIASSATGLLTISESTITQNTADDNGGGIFATGNVVLTGTTVFDNTVTNESGGGIFVLGDLTLTSSIVTGNIANLSGGGIYALGDLTLTDSTVSSNTAQLETGGGIYAAGEVRLTNSNLLDNDAALYGGGMFAQADVTITDSTVSGNDAGEDGGGIFVYGNVRITTNSVISGNTATNSDGGGIYADGDVTLTDSTVSDNVAGSDGGGIRATGDVMLTNSKVLDNDADQDGGGINANGDVRLTNASEITGNLAINDDGGGIYANGDVTLIASIVSDNEAADYGGGIYSERNVTISNSTISGNDSGYGGGVYSARNASVTDSSIIGNTAATYGGGVVAFRNATITNSTISGNSAGSHGGGLYARRDVTITRSTISGNDSGEDGGGVFVQRNLTVLNSTIFDNDADDDGGGIFADARVTLRNSTIASNNADVDGGGGGVGGGLYANGRATIENTIIVGNDDDGTNPDLILGALGNTIRSSLIGDKTGTTLTATGPTTKDANGNFIGMPGPMAIPATGANSAFGSGAGAGTLADHGGLTHTVELTTGSIAIDMGNNSLVVDASGGDQRVFPPFVRIFNGTVDMGAFESQTIITGPEIAVQINGSSVASGGTHNFGTTGGAVNVTVTIQNEGTSTLNLTGPPSISGANASDFVTTQPSSMTISPGGSATFTLSFMPTANGLRNAVLSIPNSDTTGGENPYTINLQGTGVGIPAAAPEINVQVNGNNVLSGGTANIGSTTTTTSVTVTIQNTGTGTLNITVPVVVGGAHAADFVVTTQPAASIPAGGTSSFTVAFTPGANGLRTGTISIPNNDTTGGENPYVITLQGNGSSVITPGSVLFSEDFNDPMVDPRLVTQRGTFEVLANGYFGTRQAQGGKAIATVDSIVLPAHYEVSTTVNLTPIGGGRFSNGFIIFDYVNPNNFKYAGAFATLDRFVIGSVTNGVFNRLVQTPAVISPGVDINLRVDINGSVVTLFNGVTQVGQRTFANAFTGKVGIGTNNANTSFDNLTVTPV